MANAFPIVESGGLARETGYGIYYRRHAVYGLRQSGDGEGHLQTLLDMGLPCTANRLRGQIMMEIGFLRLNRFGAGIKAV